MRIKNRRPLKHSLLGQLVLFADDQHRGQEDHDEGEVKLGPEISLLVFLWWKLAIVPGVWIRDSFLGILDWFDTRVHDQEP